MEVEPLILEVAPLNLFPGSPQNLVAPPFFLRLFHKNLVVPHQWRALVAPLVQSDSN